MSAARAGRPAAAGRGPGAAPAAPALLVPIDVRVFVVSDDSVGRAASWGRPDYDNLRFMERTDPEPFNRVPPGPTGRAGFRGAIVHWSLPDAFTAGRQSGDEPVRYPAAPNRWLVARKGPDGARWLHRAWIVASDVSPSPTGGSPWPTPTGSQTSIGAAWPIGQWPGEAELRDGRGAEDGLGTDARPLTALGAADPAFAAFVPNVNAVFSFADDLADLRAGADAGPLQYTVLGWYASAENDPLLGVAQYGPAGWQTEEQWRDLVEAGLGLTLGGQAQLHRAEQAARAWAEAHGRVVTDHARTRFPARTLCHGVVQGVPWNGTAGPTHSGVPITNPQLPGFVRPRVAIAHSAADALAAVFAQTRLDEGVDPETVAQLVDVFSAFATDLLPLLDESDDLLARLAVAVQQGWFGAADGGSAWAVVGARNAQSPLGDPAEPALTDGQRALLRALEDAQRRVDDATRVVRSEQQGLYGLWWKRERLRFEIPPRDKLKRQVAAAFAALEERLGARLERLRSERALRDAAERDLRAALDPAVAELVHTAAAAFRLPSDPVLLVSGVRRGLRHGTDGRLRADGALACRFTGQTVSGIAVAVPGGYVPVTANDVPPPHWRPEELPPEAGDLLAEAFFLDVDDAPWIARIAAGKAGLADPWELLHTIRTEQTVVWNGVLHPALDPAALEDGSMFVFDYGLGSLPQAVGVVFYTAPWSPLFLDWEVEFLPGARTPRAALEPWELPADGPRPRPLDAFTYRWRSADPPDPTGGLLLNGRSILTAQATDLLAARLEKLLADFPDAPEVVDNLDALTDAAAYARGADLLSQAATGLNLALLEQSATAFLTPVNGALDPYLHPPGGPDTTPEASPRPPGAIVTGPRFNPIRAGHLRLTRLWVVDDFGQVYKVLDRAEGVLPPSFPPALPADMVTPGDATLAALKPRITQPARLSLDLLPAADSDPGPRPGRPAADGVGAGVPGNPVLGWVMHQRLDHALLVYTADGAYQGAATDGGDRALWSPDPERWRPAQSPPGPHSIPEPRLRALVTGLLGRPDGAAALRSLLDLIDAAAWSVEPREGFVEELPLLTGRPLAVVRAGVRLAPLGLPAVDQAWELSGLDATDGFDEVPFPVQLGTAELLDDGLAGYYLDDDYSRIETVHAVPDDGYVGHRRPQVTLDGSLAPVVTLLMDPSAAVHAISGILPVVRVQLPPRFAVPALLRLAVTLRAGPVVGTAGTTTLPLPELGKGSWSWLAHPSPDQVALASTPVAAQAQAELADAYPVVREGWLRLDPGRIEAAPTFTVAPGALPTADDPGGASAATLDFTVHNDTGAAFVCTQVVVTLPIGPGAHDLTADSGGLALRAEPAGDWRFSHDAAGRLVARPESGGFALEAGAGLRFHAAGIRIGAAPGRVAVEIAATTAASGSVETTHSAVLHVEKAPTRPATLLTYTARPTAVATGQTAALAIACFNGTGGTVLCDRIQLGLPLGTGPTDLTVHPERVTAVLRTDGWNATSDGVGGFVLTPTSTPASPRAALAPGAVVCLELSGIDVVAAPGSAILAVTETATAAATGRYAAARTATAMALVRRAALGVEKRATLRKANTR
ncbi:MAG TPA: hypothetical protein VH372_06645 [Actinospica sp.]|nr:hypothetical protein [Actinospica sp.]